MRSQSRNFMVSGWGARSTRRRSEEVMSVEHLVYLAGGVVGVIGAAWRLFVEFDQWRRNRQQPKLPPPSK